MAVALALGSVVPVGAAWRLVFRCRGRGYWTAMTVAAAVLGGFALACRGVGPWAWRLGPGPVLLAVGTACALYALFYVGDRLLIAWMPAVPASGASVYALADGVSPLILTGALLLIIGPGEELYWRGLVQWELARLMPAWGAVVGASILYAGVHLVTRNPALVLAALLGGLYWGGLYALTGALPAVAISHALWDCLTLLWLPLPVGTPRYRTPISPRAVAPGPPGRRRRRARAGRRSG